MVRTITLTLPERLYEPLQRMAQATDQPLETVLLTALQASLPPLDGLPLEIVQALSALEDLDNSALRDAVFETVPDDRQHELSELLARNQAGELTTTERARLDQFQQQADLVMLRKARAAVLLRFRGQPVPTPAELRQHLSRTP